MGASRSNWTGSTYCMPAYYLLGRMFNSQRRRSLQQLHLYPGSKVLVVGRGAGLDLALLPRTVELTVAVPDPVLAKRLRHRARLLGFDVDVRVLDAPGLPFSDGCFDFILLHLALAGSFDPKLCIQETERVLRDGGKAAIFDKFVPTGKCANPLLRLANQATALCFGEVKGSLAEVLCGTTFTLRHKETAGPGGLYTIALTAKGQPQEGEGRR